LIDIEGRLSTVETIAPVVSDLQKIVIAGNGTPPMKERMNIVEAYIDKCKSEANTVAIDKKDDSKWFKRSVIGVVIVQTIGIVFAFFK